MIAGRVGGAKICYYSYKYYTQGFLAAEKIRNTVQTAQFTDKGIIIKVTVSIGVVICSETDQAKDIIKNADRALYIAKKMEETGWSKIK